MPMQQDPQKTPRFLMQERFTYQLIADLSTSTALEIWEHSGHLISDEYLLLHGIRAELYNQAVERIRSYAEQQLVSAPGKTEIHPQFADELWPIVERQIDTHLEPVVDIFFYEYCELLRTGKITSMVVTPTVVSYFDHFCEALRHSAVESLDFPKEIAMTEGGICKTLILNTPQLETIVCEDICSTLLNALYERRAANLPVPGEYRVTHAYTLPPYARLARWYQETGLSVCVTIEDPKRTDHRRFLVNKLQSRSHITAKDVDWILEEWYTGRKRLRDAENCPKCGEYDPRGKHYFRYIAGRGQYKCVSEIGVGKRKRHGYQTTDVFETNLEESGHSPPGSLISSDDESSD